MEPTTVLGGLILRPSLIPMATRYFRVSDFSGDNRKVFEALVAMHERGDPIDAALIADKSGVATKTVGSMIAEVEAPSHVETYIVTLWNDVITRHMNNLLDEMKSAAKANAEPAQKMRLWQEALGKLQARMTTEFPQMEDPAEILRRMRSWSCRTGIAPYDKLFRVPSGGLSTIVGNPNSGKTTMALQIALTNAKESVPVHLFLAESEMIEAQLTFLSQTKAIKASFANRLRYDQYARTPENLQVIHEAWEKELKGLPIYVYSVQGSTLDEVIARAEPIQDSVIILDHIYAFVWQGDSQAQAYANFARGFAGTRRIATQGNNVVIVFNQYTKGEQTQKDAWRNAEAGFGGAAQLNMSALKLNLRMDKAISTPGRVGVRTIVVKSKVNLVVDETGNPVNPNWQETLHYIDLRHRLIVSSSGVGYENTKHP